MTQSKKKKRKEKEYWLAELVVLKRTCLIVKKRKLFIYLFIIYL